MGRKLADFSKMSIALGAVLYIFGFITVNSFLASFGIVAFDVVNSRFVVAGIFPLVPLLLALYLGWQWHKIVPLNNYFAYKNAGERIWKTIQFLILIQIVSNSLVSIMDIHNVATRPVVIDKVASSASFTVPGIRCYLANHGLKATSLNYCLAFTIFWLKFLLPLLFFIWVSIYIRHRYRAKHPAVAKDANASPSSPVAAAKEHVYNAYKHLWIAGWLSLLAIFCIGMTIYSWNRVIDGFFGFADFGHDEKLTSGLMFAWIFQVFIQTYFFLYLFDFSKESMQTKDVLLDPNKLQHWFYRLIIPAITSLLLFGKTVFPRVSFGIGGGEPREVNINDRSGTVGSNGNIRSFLIGESGQFFFVVQISSTSSKAIQLNKSDVHAITTLDQKPAVAVKEQESNKAAKKEGALKVPFSKTSLIVK